MTIHPEALLFTKIIISLFVGVLFTQSGMDKVFDYQGNLGYIKSVFEKTFLSAFSTLLLLVITLLEVAAGILSISGAWFIFFSANNTIALIGLSFSAIALLSLFTGQRIAKDYAGAASLVSYFILSILGILIVSL
jgi:putative oxidoreductase